MQHARLHGKRYVGSTNPALSRAGGAAFLSGCSMTALLSALRTEPHAANAVAK